MGAGSIAGAAIGGTLGFIGNFLAAKDAKLSQARFRRRQKQGIERAETRATDRTKKVVESDLFQGANRFLTGIFNDPLATGPLGQDFAKGVRQAQAARGLLGGGAAVSQEASGLAAFSAQLQSSLLPQAQQFARFEENLFQSIFAFEAPLQVAYTTGGALAGVTPPPIQPGAFSSGLQGGAAGALGGAQIGASIDRLGATERGISAKDLLDEANARSPFGSGFSSTPRMSIPTTLDPSTRERLSTIDRLGGLI